MRRVLTCLLLACDPKPAEPVVAPPAVVDAAIVAPATVVDAATDAATVGATEAPDVLLSDPAKLGALYGYDFQTMVGGSLAFADLVAVLEADVAEAKRADPSSGPGLAFGHRLLDTKLLHDASARWELIGVSQRFDRDFVEPSRCGELRFIYRLRYEKTVKGLAIASRMPATAAVSFWNAASSSSSSSSSSSPDCSAVWKAWPNIPPPADLARRFKSVELDVQTVRWPSTIRGDMAGHAEYTLRALVRSPKDPLRLVPGFLENTPDVALLARAPAFKKKLLEWIRANEKRVEQGTAILPDEFLAKASTDVTPHGLARRHNRPFRQIFDAAELPEKLARRLDGMSCPGCHASRSIAGFHFLGDETAPKDSVNAILVGRSPHLQDELARRRSDLGAKIAGKPTRAIPFADHTSERGESGSHCSISSTDFPDWKCAAGLVCARDVGSEQDGIGACTPPRAGVGDPCEVGHVTLSTNPHADRVARMETASSCICDTNHVGFPNGMCTAACGVLGPGEVCGAIPQLTQFNSCLGGSRSFEDCIKQNSTPAAVRSCDESHPCRDDYVCARTGANSAGTCMPPYFLFQLRVDGHP